MATGDWWNIWTLASAQAEEIVPHTIESKTKPVQGGNSQWGQIYTVAGPYKNKADAQKAIGQYHGPPPNSTGAGGATVLPSVDAFFNALTQGSTWLRVGEGLLGVILIAVGVAKLSGAENVITRAVSATPVGKVAKAI